MTCMFVWFSRTQLCNDKDITLFASTTIHSTANPAPFGHFLYQPLQISLITIRQKAVRSSRSSQAKHLSRPHRQFSARLIGVFGMNISIDRPATERKRSSAGRHGCLRDIPPWLLRQTAGSTSSQDRSSQLAATAHGSLVSTNYRLPTFQRLRVWALAFLALPFPPLPSLPSNS